MNQSVDIKNDNCSSLSLAATIKQLKVEKVQRFNAVRAEGQAGLHCCLTELKRAESRLLPGSRPGVVVLSDNRQGSENAAGVEQKHLIDEMTQKSM